MLAMLRPLLSLTFDLPELDGGHYREAVEALKETLDSAAPVPVKGIIQ